MYGGIIEAIGPFCEKIRSVAEKGHKAYILTHMDADGLVSAGIISMTLVRLGVKCVTRALHDISPASIRELKSDLNDFFILFDIRTNMASTLVTELDNRWIIIDHHKSLTEVPSSLYHSSILNAYRNNIDGEFDISSGGLAYILATQIDGSNWDLSPLAIVSALADNQDHGNMKLLSGLNSEIMKVAQSHGLLTVELDLRFTGRETKPIHEAMASTVVPFMDGISGNSENAYSIIKNTGIDLMENGRRRVPADLGQEEKTVLLEAIVKFVSTTSRYPYANLANELSGYAYTLPCEDLRSPLRDAREFSMLLNACGKSRRPGVGIGICMGDRNFCLGEGEKIATQFKTILHKCISGILAENWRINLDKFSVFINGENILDEWMLEDVASILFRSLIFGNRAIIFWTRSRDGFHKFYCKAWPDSKFEGELSNIVTNCAKSFGGSGVSLHKNEVLCRIPSTGYEDFVTCIKRVIVEFNSKNYA